MNAKPSQPFEHIEVIETPQVTILTIVDARINNDEQVRALTDELVAAVGNSPHTKFVVDMKHVEYITSMAIMPLVVLRKTAEEMGGRIVLCNLADVVAKVLTISQLVVESRNHVRHFVMAQDLESALRILG